MTKIVTLFGAKKKGKIWLGLRAPTAHSFPKSLYVFFYAYKDKSTLYGLQVRFYKFDHTK